MTISLLRLGREDHSITMVLSSALDDMEKKTDRLFPALFFLSQYLPPRNPILR